MLEVHFLYVASTGGGRKSFEEADGDLECKL